MTLTRMLVRGYRGFSVQQTLEFAVPNGELGSGITFLTGSNNSGKSSILESLRARAGNQPASFTSGTRNGDTDEVAIEYDINGKLETITSIRKGSSESKQVGRDETFRIFVLPSRRAFEPYFHKHSRDRDDYIRAAPLPAQRSSTLTDFSGRLFKTFQDPTEFNEVLARVLGYEADWAIDQSDQGSYFLKFSRGKHSHSSDGMGEGVVSVFAIVDALYDSLPGEMVVIDEPELSLHPSLQKRVALLISEYSKDRQVVISTHSPYFIDLQALANGANLIRVCTYPDTGTVVNPLSGDAKASIKSLLSNANNPHIWGLDAKEIFFQEDGIVLVEGQEDVVFYPQVAKLLGRAFPGRIFGWGVGGAGNMKSVAKILNDLGFKRVVGVLDSDKAATIPALKADFPDYHFVAIPAKDVRTKPARPATIEIRGLLDGKKLRPEYAADTANLLKSIDDYLAG